MEIPLDGSLSRLEPFLAALEIPHPVRDASRAGVRPSSVPATSQFCEACVTAPKLLIGKGKSRAV